MKVLRWDGYHHRLIILHFLLPLPTTWVFLPPPACLQSGPTTTSCHSWVLLGSIHHHHSLPSPLDFWEDSCSGVRPMEVGLGGAPWDTTTAWPPTFPSPTCHLQYLIPLATTTTWTWPGRLPPGHPLGLFPCLTTYQREVLRGSCSIGGSLSDHLPPALPFGAYHHRACSFYCHHLPAADFCILPFSAWGSAYSTEQPGFSSFYKPGMSG